MVKQFSGCSFARASILLQVFAHAVVKRDCLRKVLVVRKSNFLSKNCARKRKTLSSQKPAFDSPSYER